MAISLVGGGTPSQKYIFTAGLKKTAAFYILNGLVLPCEYELRSISYFTREKEGVITT